MKKSTSRGWKNTALNINLVKNMKSFDKIKIGFELEYEGCSYYGNSDSLRSGLGEYGDLKSDGSLNYGFELASKVNKFSDFCGKDTKSWDEMFKRIKNRFNAKSEGHTGMHIHVARASLSKDDLQKINYFVYSSQKLMDLLGNRTATTYSRYEMNSDAEVLNSQGFKYRYLNTGKRDTIEFRFFKSPITVARFLCNMQFVMAIVGFVKTNEVDKEFYLKQPGRNLMRFFDYVNSEKECFHYLDKFLKSKDKLIKNGEICEDRVLNCLLYPTQKVKQSLIKKFGVNAFVSVGEVERAIGRYNPEKSPRTVAYLSRVLDRAKKRKAIRVHMFNLDKVKESA